MSNTGASPSESFEGEADGWPDPLAGEYTLRFTARAMEDLGVSNLYGSELDEIEAATKYPDIVSKFVKMRTVEPCGTEAPLSKVHRGDIYKLDGRNGARAVTWHDTAHGVVWFLAFTPKHDYTLFEDRAARPEKRGLGGSNQLMPSAQDHRDLLDERGGSTAELQRVVESLSALVTLARTDEGQVVRGELAGTVRAEACVLVADSIRTLHLRFRTPPLRSGIVESQFEYYLAATVPGADLATIRRAPFPDEHVRGAAIVSVELAD